MLQMPRAGDPCKHRKPRFVLMSYEHYKRLRTGGDPCKMFRTSDIPDEHAELFSADFARLARSEGYATDLKEAFEKELRPRRHRSLLRRFCFDRRTSLTSTHSKARLTAHEHRSYRRPCPPSAGWRFLRSTLRGNARLSRGQFQALTFRKALPWRQDASVRRVPVQHQPWRPQKR